MFSIERLVLVAARLLAVPALLTAMGCASSAGGSHYVHPNFDLANYERVAVVPLENLTSERFAAERVREILNVEISAQGLFDVVESGEVNRALRKQSVADVTQLTAEEIAALGQALGVQALLMGSVMEFQERRTGTISLPEIALSLRLVDCETGIVIWSVADARAGAKLATRLFGVGEESQTDATLRLVRGILHTIE